MLVHSGFSILQGATSLLLVLRSRFFCIASALLFTSMLLPAHAATTALANQPSATTANVPANVLFTPSVEFPTAISVAHVSNTYTETTTYVGYFDPYKCYSYDGSTTTPWTGNNYFVPVGFTIGVTNAVGSAGLIGNHRCSGYWSGNFLNWATMQTIDPFRQALTGGDRYIDTATQTVLQKAYASSQGSTSNFPNRSITTNVSTVTPFAWAGFYMRVWSLGRAMYFGTAANPNNTNQVQIRVKVCVPTVVAVTGGTRSMLESNCVAYGANYKPEGLIQANNLTMRYGVVAYLNEATHRDGGVVRARMKDVGPLKSVPGASPITNTALEWSSTDGTFLTNPDPTDASATGVANSGVINYLNKFGQSNSYMTYDNVSELYYAGLRYLRNMPNVPEWTTSPAPTAAAKDNFPVITSPGDPIQYSCQKNFIIGIGDVNTHRDKNVPGATLAGSEPTKPAAVSADTAFDAKVWTDKISTYENANKTDASNIPNPLGSALTGSDAASYYIAGMAYWAHTNDIRSDITDTQTVSTYWVDVLEFQTYKHKNQYWLAAKYGGFKDADANGQPGNGSASVTSEWRANSGLYGTNQLPDNYFVASDPDRLVAGLNSAFNSIAGIIASATGVGISSSNLQAGTNGSKFFSVFYDSSDWSGDLKAQKVTSINATTGALTFTPVLWSAQSKLDILTTGSGWQSGNLRKVVFGKWVGTAFSAAPFITANLTAGQTSDLTATGQPVADVLNYLRGDKSKQVTSGGTLRNRSHILGDIVSSEAVYVEVPGMPYADAYNPGYSAYKAANSTRAPMVYVGANDGMVHAFNAGTTGAASDGTERWAYIPSFVFNGPNATPAVDGLAALTNTAFVHHYYVNATPATGDVDFNKTDGQSGSPDWRTILVGGLGKGGKGFYAIDVTNPAAMTSETIVAGKVLWEFKDADMGYSYQTPLIVKTAKWGWVVLLTSGYNNTSGSNPGNGYLYVVNARNGALIQKIGTGAGTALNPSGFTHINLVIPNIADGKIAQIYGGDLLGNMWRFDFSSATANVPAPTNVFIAKDSSNVVQAITTPPLVAIDPVGNARYVAFATGRLLDPADTFLNQTQSLYVLRDGNLTVPYTATAGLPNSLPLSLNFPLSRSNMSVNTNLLLGAAFNTTTPMGWYYDFPGSTVSGTNVALERNIIPMAYNVFNGQLILATTIPAASICSPNGTSVIYILNIAEGTSTLVDPVTGLPVPSIASSQQITKVSAVTVNGPGGASSGVVKCDTTGGCNDVVNASVKRPALMNWREIIRTQ